MSQTIEIDCDAEELFEHVLNEHVLGTGIPVHPYSVINATMSSYNRCHAFTDSEGKGVLFIEADDMLKSYGCSDNSVLLRAFRICGVNYKFLD